MNFRDVMYPLNIAFFALSAAVTVISLACHTTEARSLMEAPAAVVTVGDVFNVVDIGGSGGITAEEVIRFTAALGIRLTDEQVAAFMAADKDGDLQVDADEWLASLNAAVEGSLVSWSDSFSSLPMDVLIGGPLKYD